MQFTAKCNLPRRCAYASEWGVRRLGCKFHDPLPEWQHRFYITDVDGAMFIQIRLSFINDIEAGASPELSGLGLVYAGN